MRLGDTGTIKSTLGEYEITPISFEILESKDEHQPSKGLFIIVDVTIKNIGDNTLEGPEITKGVLFNDDGLRDRIRTHYDFTNQITGDLQPGEEVTGQLLFDLPESEYYELIFGWAQESVSNEVTWHFDTDEAK